jgi:TRAP-type C4-dicarboxylate transport system permease small subunit
MPLPTPRRVAVSLPLLGALCGALIGLASFAVIAALWRVGAARLALPAAEAILLITLTGMAAAILTAQPARIRRARVPIGRAMPHAWWPPQHDPVPLVVACVGTPIAAGVGAAMWLFH